MTHDYIKKITKGGFTANIFIIACNQVDTETGRKGQ